MPVTPQPGSRPSPPPQGPRRARAAGAELPLGRKREPGGETTTPPSLLHGDPVSCHLLLTFSGLCPWGSPPPVPCPLPGLRARMT